MTIPLQRPWADSLASWYFKRRYRPARWLNRTLGRTRLTDCRYLGARFLVDLQDYIGFGVASRFYEWQGLALLAGACRRSNPSLFIDVGANIGLYSCIVARRGLVKRVLAFEPDRDNYERLTANIRLNGLDGIVEARQLAVGQASGTVSLQPGPAVNRGVSRIVPDAASGYPVSMVALDEVVELDGGVVALKIDVEGYESEVLAGADRLLRRNRGYAQIEALNDHAAKEVTRLMAGCGWRPLGRNVIDLWFERA